MAAMVKSPEAATTLGWKGLAASRVIGKGAVEDIPLEVLKPKLSPWDFMKINRRKEEEEATSSSSLLDKMARMVGSVEVRGEDGAVLFERDFEPQVTEVRH